MNKPLTRQQKADMFLAGILGKAPKPPAAPLTPAESRDASSLGDCAKRFNFNRQQAQGVTPTPAPTVAPDVAFERLVQGTTEDETITATDLNDLVMKELH